MEAVFYNPDLLSEIIMNLSVEELKTFYRTGGKMIRSTIQSLLQNDFIYGKLVVKIYRDCILSVTREINGDTFSYRKEDLFSLSHPFDFKKYGYDTEYESKINKNFLESVINKLSQDQINEIKRLYEIDTLENLNIEDFTNDTFSSKIVRIARPFAKQYIEMLKKYSIEQENEILDRISYSDMMIIKDYIIGRLEMYFYPYFKNHFIHCLENKLKTLEYLRNKQV